MPSITWKFVTVPEATAPVLLDMNRSNGKVVIDMGREFNISPPALRQSFATNSLLDGGRLTSSAFENRVLKFSLGFTGSVTEKIAAVAAVNKELRKPRNLIMYRPHPSAKPMFFRTMRSDQYGVTNRGGAAEVWNYDYEVIAEPFAIGEMIQPIVNVATSNDPIAATNAQRLNFPTIIGDAPAPAFVHIEFAPALPRLETFYLASRTHENALFNHARQFVAADITGFASSFTFSAANTSGGSAIATNFSGGPSMGNKVTFDSSQVSDAFSIRGRYRVLIRAHASVAPSKFEMRLEDKRFNTEGVFSKELSWDANTTANWQHLDFGVFSHPAYETPNEFGYSGQPPGVGGLTFNLQVGRLSGTGNFEADYALFLPADETLMMFSPHQSRTDVVLDGPNEMVYGMYESSPFDKTATFWYFLSNANGLIPWRGAIPDLVPGAPNSWYFLNSQGDMADLFNFDVYYWPRWLEVATP